MELGLAGRHVLVTGGSRGIGLACARAFGQEGARVSIASRGPTHVEAALVALREAGVQASGFVADLADAAQAEALVARVEEEAGALDVMVCSAGAAQRTPFHELQAQHWHDAMGSKFFATVHVLTPVLQRMAARGRGSAVNVVGSGGKVARPTHLAGGAANAALMLATAGLAAAYGPQGLRVNAVNPGATLTERLAQGLQAEARLSGVSPEQVRQKAERSLPLGRFATPEEIARAVVFLASDAASYVNGAILSMDGALVPMVV